MAWSSLLNLMIVTLSKVGLSMRETQPFSVHRDPGPLRSGCPYAEHHQLIRSVIRCREDACRFVISVTNVTDDVSEDDSIPSVVGNVSCMPQLCTKRDIWREKFAILNVYANVLKNLMAVFFTFIGGYLRVTFVVALDVFSCCKPIM